MKVREGKNLKGLHFHEVLHACKQKQWHVLFMGYKINLPSGSGTTQPLSLDRFFKQNCQSESSQTLRPWHFGSLLPRHLRSQQVTCYLGLLSGVWMYMTWQVLEPQVMSGMHRCCVLLLWSDWVRCFCSTSGALFGRPPLCVDLGRKWKWLPLLAPYSLWTVRKKKKKSLDQLLIKALTKLWEKVTSVWGFVASVYTGVWLWLCGGRWGAYRWEEKKMKEQRWKNSICGTCWVHEVHSVRQDVNMF